MTAELPGPTSASGSTRSSADAAGPYQGLDHFPEDRASFFFGRETDIDILLANLLTTRLTVLYGASGVGKSSVLLAGVLPRLRKQPLLVPVVVRDWQSASFGVLVREAMADALKTVAGFEVSTETGTLDAIIVQAAEKSDCELVLVFDQFEEYFRSRAAPDVQVPFEAELATTVNRTELPVHVLLSLREDSLAQLDRLEGRIPAILGNCIRLEHLDRRAAEETIRLPLARYAQEHERVTIDDRLVDHLLEECAIGRLAFGRRSRPVMAEPETLAGPEAATRIELPFLQLMLTRLWQAETEQDSRQLRLTTLNDLGGVAHIVSHHLDQMLEPLPAAEKRLLVTMFDRLVTPSGSKIAYAQRDLEAIVREREPKLAPRVVPVLERLADRTVRVLRDLPAPPGDTVDGRRFELLHDVLGHAVLDWLRRSIAAQRLRRAKRRIWLVSGGVFGSVLLVLALVVYWNYQLWVETRPWGRLTSILTGRDYPLTQDVAQIGRRVPDTAHLPFQVRLMPNSISRFHLTISRNHYAVDMRSLFGTVVNGEFLPYAKSRRLQEGDLIVLAGTAAFRYQPIAYEPWDYVRQFLDRSTIAAESLAPGWGLLVDGRARRVTPLMRDESYVAMNTDGSVELSATKVDNAVMIVRRRHFPGGTPYAVSSQTMSLEAESRCRPDIDVVAVHSGSQEIFSAEDSITVEDIADGRDLFADMKKGDYCYGRFLLREGEEMFWLFDPVTRETHDIHGLVYVAGDARFQIIPMVPGVESDTSSARE
jgi:hypothetical protein